jgi:hypothetical protein
MMRPLAATLATALTVIALAPTAVPAQLPGLGLGAGVRYAAPSGDFGDLLDPGYGGYLKAEIGAVLVGVAAEANLTRFAGEGGADDVTVLGVQVGPRLSLGLFKAGLDIGWYSEVEKSGYTPSLSLGLGPLEGGAGITFFDGGRWLFLRAGVRF